ncbi:hypothetical protein D3C76_662610 [compost metagenome]
MAKKKNENRRNMNQTAVIRQVMPRDRIPGPDELLAALHEPLPADTVSKIIELRRQKIPRSQIAKQLGISKLHVNQELMRRGG